MSQPFIGQVQAFSFNFPPRGWGMCNGQLLPINQNQALFSLIETTYGGNGQTTFALPDLRGRVSIHQGQGPGAAHTIGDRAGAENVTLQVSELPAHGHGAQAATTASSTSPANTVFATGGAYGAPAATTMHGSMIQAAGGNQPHQNVPPYLVLNWCIALTGIFPSST